MRPLKEQLEEQLEEISDSTEMEFGL